MTTRATDRTSRSRISRLLGATLIIAVVAVAALVVVLVTRTNTPSRQPQPTTPSRRHTVPSLDGVFMGLGRTGTPFGPNFWGRALPPTTPINPNSARYVREILNSLENSGPASKEAYLQTTAAPPIYVVPANQPYVPVHGWNPDRDRPMHNQFLDKYVFAGGIPIPPFAEAATDNTDHTMIIYQPARDTLWEMWKVQKDSGGNWEVGWAGKTVDAHQSDGIFTPPLGTSATGVALSSLVTRVEELQMGDIEHPIDLELARNIVLAPCRHRQSSCVLPANTPGATKPYSWPANRNPDGVSTSPYAIPEGLRFRLDPKLNLAQFHLTPVAHAIAVAGQKYGFLVENTGPDNNIKLENPQPYEAAGLPNPYKQLFGRAAGSDYSTRVMANFPWSHLEALPFNYGDPSGSS